MADPDGPITGTQKGRTLGPHRAGHDRFFATPSAGPLRFPPPAPALPRSGARATTGSGAASGLVPEPTAPGAEVLAVSMRTPAAEPASRPPARSSIHGGASASLRHGRAAFARNSIIDAAGEGGPVIVIVLDDGYAQLAPLPDR